MARIQSAPELERRLSVAIDRMRRLVSEEPDPPFQSILAQLEALAGWTEGGASPSAEQRARLDFGQLASRHLDEVDASLAAELYEIASWVTHW
jgi:hypothetical protein